mmetsp:Transcript_62929/g.135125  ORF Transcript_62929/g.135125 Transcript_62929/m.135125 type:complete len:234 (-) Transcript_62929:88-789(-)
MTKRVEAATKAMDISKQIVRRSVNLEDEKLMRKLINKGIKKDKDWHSAFQEYCAARGVGALDQKSHDKEFIATFIERNLANSINQEWAKKIIYSNPNEKKEKKEKKDKQKKDKKRKASESSSSDKANAVANTVSAGSTGPAPGLAGPTAPGMAAMNMYGHPGMPFGHMGGMIGPPHQMGMIPGSMAPHMGFPMGGMAPGLGGLPELQDDPRARKKAKHEKGEKGEKTKKAKKQ